MINAIVVRVGETPVVKEIETNYETMRDLVGGMVQCVRLYDDVVMWCNEEGLYRCEFNRNVPDRAKNNEWAELLGIVEVRPAGLAEPGEMGHHRVHGDFFLTRMDEDGEMVSVNAGDVDKYFSIFS